MKLMPIRTIGPMTPWEVVEGALARRKPKRNQAWLAQQLGVGTQAVTNWKLRGSVPTGQYRALADLLHLTVEQIEGRAPAPWEKGDGWPFPDIDRARFDRLTEMQQGEIQGEVRKLIEKFEAPRESGKSSSSPPRDGPRKAA